MDIIEKETRVCFKLQNMVINIPSRMYPLESDDYKMITFNNTEYIEDEKIIEIFDSITFETGRCFTNTQKLCNALNEAGYNAVQYVGWIFIEDTLPVHHSFAIVNGKHLLDTTVNILSQDADFFENISRLPQDQYYKEAAKYFIELNKKPHHEVLVCGQVPKEFLYIGSPASAEQGIQRNKDLRLIYPEHLCFKNVQGNSTRLQRTIAKEKEKAI